MEKRLYRSEKEKIFAGVAGGIAEYFEVDPVLVRIGFVALTFITGVGIVIYIACMFIMPKRPAASTGTAADGSPMAEVMEETIPKKNRSQFFGILLILLGALFLMKNYVPCFGFDEFVPILLVLLGLYLVVSSKKN